MADIEEAQPQITAFERIKHINKQGQEFWSARELMSVLTYGKWQDFHKVIRAAMEVHRNSGGNVGVIFRTVRSESPTASRKYPQLDYHLTRHACYLVVLSSEGSKPVVSLAKTYFAVTTEQYEQLIQSEEDQLRIELREKLLRHHAELSAHAKRAGVLTTQQFASFYNAGYRGLYRETASQIRARKGLKARQEIADYMGILETAANDFRAALALTLLQARGVSDVATANETHYEAGDEVRQTLVRKEIYPERLPTPIKSYQQLLRECADRERLAAQQREGLWGYIEEANDQQQIETSQVQTVELGMKITLEPLENDLQFNLEYVDAPVPDAEYSSLSVIEPISTLIHLYWVPEIPDTQTQQEVMVALSDYLTYIIQQDEQLNALYGGKSPLHVTIEAKQKDGIETGEG